MIRHPVIPAQAGIQFQRFLKRQMHFLGLY